ncbi:hypothetical protein Micbo1qcDRAFT_60838 [Microdochium bolleyi]|uniref:Uncharacterized protein n=1 Tax=Microdochium bolleyi TaxID=196109 RepID=A0A136J4Y8_9PEZI|nr:hypothetical protein Micbo1qcDRAFT_60838 [Microdochium bolleyi]
MWSPVAFVISSTNGSRPCTSATVNSAGHVSSHIWAMPEIWTSTPDADLEIKAWDPEAFCNGEMEESFVSRTELAPDHQPEHVDEAPLGPDEMLWLLPLAGAGCAVRVLGRTAAWHCALPGVSIPRGVSDAFLSS